MTPTQNTPEPALSSDLLADLHAGVVDEPEASRLWARVAQDRQAQAVLAALDATVADLRALPALSVPPDLAARLDATLGRPAVATGPVAPVVDLAARRRHRSAWGGAAVLVTAAAAVGVVAVGVGPMETSGTLVADRPTLALSATDLGEGLGEALGATDLGPLSRPAALRACLQANSVAPAGEPLGAREVVVDGEPGVLLILPTGEIGRFRLIVVGEDCGPGTPSLIAEDTVGR